MSGRVVFSEVLQKYLYASAGRVLAGVEFNVLFPKHFKYFKQPFIDEELEAHLDGFGFFSTVDIFNIFFKAAVEIALMLK